MTAPRRSLLLGTATLPLFAIRAQAQSAVNITIASSHPVQNYWVSNMKNVFQPEVEKFLRDNGNTHRINWREAYGGTLYRFQDTMEAVRDNITDIGYVGTLWEGSTMPLQNVTYFTPFATGDHGLVANTFERMNETVPAIRQNWESLNMIPLSSFITDTYHIWSTFPVRSLDDLRNRKISAPGTSANWLTGTGATPVDGALTTYYTDIQTGVSEGALSFFVGILPTRVYEVAKYITKCDVGAMYVGGIAVNRQRYGRYPEPVRNALTAAGKISTQKHIEDVTARVAASEAEMVQKGAIISTLPAAERERWIRGLPNIARTWVDSSGPAARDVLNAYFAAIRAAGQTPGRNWDREVAA
ncbi:C4-dicarboxylate TRAP transporter substrate-binding protein [Neoroseomonas oryzicola]|uniref:C4-dicarboxylate ABC transporter substrate-binding protein n=1 Tax=Neoroseomonas oryzicola TaxID=535904 RepID=A0A9X9WBY1_9PROT|nr:C4-dicarboxylate TRAP transporter substrate-binding protein [Neoroseomonas oryzicola]MBR0657841.1 C4-dicarboxylate ABC transporter substrate-binding protein [Neoroseomonas oryzicola]NKE18591.1 TRAP transporter substrate-binding protein DctP [Neoroseomonas oryzicola]